MVLAERPAADSAAVGGGEDRRWHRRRSCGPSSCRGRPQRRPREVGRIQDGPEFHQWLMEYRRPPWPASASATRRAWPSDPSWPGHRRCCHRGWHCAGRWRRGDHRFRRRPLFLLLFLINQSISQQDCWNILVAQIIFDRIESTVFNFSSFAVIARVWQPAIRTRAICTRNLLCNSIVRPTCTWTAEGAKSYLLADTFGEFWHSATAVARNAFCNGRFLGNIHAPVFCTSQCWLVGWWWLGLGYKMYRYT